MADINHGALALGIVFMAIVLAYGAFMLSLVLKEYKRKR